MKHIQSQLSDPMDPAEDQILRFQKICFSFLKTQNSCKIGISGEIFEKFQIYLSHILDWNKRIHLVSKGDANPERILRHFVDSLTIFRVIEIPQKAQLLDLGAGAGFPSVPIKIVRNDVIMSLIESVRKKSLFLQKLIKDLRLKDVSAVNKRAEDLVDDPDYKEKFDIVTAKALGKLRETMKLAAPFLRKQGLLVAYKGEKVEKEIKVIEEKDFLIKKKISVKIPDFDLKRTIVVMEKIALTNRSTD